MGVSHPAGCPAPLCRDEWTERSEIRPYTNTKEFFKVKSKCVALAVWSPSARDGFVGLAGGGTRSNGGMPSTCNMTLTTAMGSACTDDAPIPFGALLGVELQILRSCRNVCVSKRAPGSCWYGPGRKKVAKSSRAVSCNGAFITERGAGEARVCRPG
eukprot:38814-Chlamydomonas_euryale.AAC.2